MSDGIKPGAAVGSGRTGADLSYRMSWGPADHRVRATFGGQTVADSSRAMVLRETRLAPVYYFPREDVREDLLERSAQVTHCPFKGNASYWSLAVGERRVANAAWAYEDPLPEARELAGYVAFFWGDLDEWFEDERPVAQAPQPPAGGGENPLLPWVLGEAMRVSSPGELLAGFVQALRERSMPIARLELLVRTLHPQLFARLYSWEEGDDEVSVGRLPHEALRSAELKTSPYAPILDGAGGVRRRLETDPDPGFGELETLARAGATDYVAMPLVFSDGQINILSLISRTPGGFGIDDLGLVHEVLAPLARLVEVFALRESSATLLETYLGRLTGPRVLAGEVRRGDGSETEAVLWLCDLRDSTVLSESLSMSDYLALLNTFFDCSIGAVTDGGGEVLKLIGDAVFAIFPVTQEGGAAGACRRAVCAARDMCARMAAANEARAARGLSPLSFGTAVHRGVVTYGNVGGEGRLDFTVIGSAANEAARVVQLCKDLDRRVLLTRSVAQMLDGGAESLGTHALRGVAEPREIFSLRDE